MKKLLNSKKFIQKIFIAIIITLSLSFAVPVKSNAGIGGLLLDPIFDLGGTVLDAIVGLLQMCLVDGNINNSSDSTWLNFFMAEPGHFMSNVDELYSEFKYSPSSEDATETISENDLDKSLFGNGTYGIPLLKYSPEKIFSGKIPALDINFVNPTDWEKEGYEDGDEMNKRSIAQILKGTIASWYVSLRNLSVVGLMLILVYVGIRIVISSTASDKSKYKQMLMDWLIALCLLFCMHYIMTFTATIVTEISKAVSGTNASNNGNSISVKVIKGNGDEAVSFNTDLMGLLRFKMQSPSVWYKVLYFILYLAMVAYTCLFTFTYLKRVLIMAFLTLIAPLVALTYPIDKVKDGKSQAFDMWFKEYVFNALLQPFHLIIYTIFVGSAIELAAKNPLFAIAALGFLTPAENLLRKFFGFEKSSTSGALGAFAGVAGGAAAFNMMSKALSNKRGAKSSPKGNKDIRTRVPDGNTPSLATGINTSGNNGGDGDSATEENQAQLTDEAQAWENYANTGQFWPDSGTNQAQLTDEAQAWENYANTGQFESSSDSHQNSSHIPYTRMTHNNNNGVGARQLAKAKANSKGNNKSSGKIRTIARGVGNVAKKTGIAAGKGALRLGGRALAAAPGAIIGMGLGIAGSDLGDIWKYTMAGGALTSATLPGMASSAGSFVSEAYREGVYGTAGALRRQKHKEYMKSTELDALYQHEFKHKDGSELSKSELTAKKEQGAYFNDLGIEGKDSIKAVKLQDRIKQELKDKGMEEDNADKRGQALAANIMKELEACKSDENCLKEKSKVMELRKSLAKKCEKAGMGSKDTKETVDIIIEGMKSIRKVENDY